MREPVGFGMASQIDLSPAGRGELSPAARPIQSKATLGYFTIRGIHQQSRRAIIFRSTT
jgi:hypothetical protein